MKRSLPLIDERGIGSIRADGSRVQLHPHEVTGRYTTRRNVIFAVLIVVYVALPFVQIGGRPAVFLDVLHRRFYLFGAAFNAQDFWLVFFLLAGAALVLLAVTAIWGRVWCGYACPQTVFLEGLARRIERWVEGPASVRAKADRGPRTAQLVARKMLKHVLFLALSLFLAHVLLSYFVSLPSLWQMVTGSPMNHPVAFGWMIGISGAIYFDLGFFREQLCFIVCPYGRLQSTMMDSDTQVIGYDALRGEPRGKASDPAAADCVDCGRCVNVCPTGIDIRKGLQMECIACAACVDACDGVMKKVGRPEGLIRYDSTRSLEGGVRRFSRGRLALYGGATLLWVVGFSYALSGHESFEANLLRPQTGSAFIVADGEVLNVLELHLVNKLDAPQRFRLENRSTGSGNRRGMRLEMPSEVRLGPGGSRTVRVVARVPLADASNATDTRIYVEGVEASEARVLHARFLAPGG